MINACDMANLSDDGECRIPYRMVLRLGER
jgi:hypothetical protein